MPSLSLLRRGSKQQQDQQLLPGQQQSQLSPRYQDGGGEQPGSGVGTGERERERKFSKRDLFGGLLGRSKGRSTSAKPGRGTGAESPTKLPVSLGRMFPRHLLPTVFYLSPWTIDASICTSPALCRSIFYFFLWSWQVPLKQGP